MSIETAPKHIQLAVDLIQLLEENQIAPELALQALAIVTEDYKNKLAQQPDPQDKLKQ
ncbi:pleiotropic regulatory protein RsmS [Agarivorans sp.]|uniref:pleiotropic regulatory protein RsmS n=1 Tax=Agarivorans sp. TaxID=1872412 RepID=UPI003D093150